APLTMLPESPCMVGCLGKYITRPGQKPSQLRKSSRGDKTAIELFLGGVKTLASQLSTTTQVLVAIIDSSRSEQPSSKWPEAEADAMAARANAAEQPA
ncbi:MAG: hypothetical protein ABSG68_25280, partial [Thermoguttaceae bacterium]